MIRRRQASDRMSPTVGLVLDVDGCRRLGRRRECSLRTERKRWRSVGDDRDLEGPADMNGL
jgi:hypothetical protein